MTKRQKSASEKHMPDAYESSKSYMNESLRNSDSAFDTWEYLKNNNPFQSYPMMNLPGSFDEPSFFSDFSQDIFKSEASAMSLASSSLKQSKLLSSHSLVPSIPSSLASSSSLTTSSSSSLTASSLTASSLTASSSASLPTLTKSTSQIKTRSANKLTVYDRKDYLEDNYRLKNQLIFSNSIMTNSSLDNLTSANSSGNSSSDTIKTVVSTATSPQNKAMSSSSSLASSLSLSHSMSMPILSHHNSNSTANDVNPSTLSSWMSSNAKDKRRERNKVFARKTRLKRKQELEELRDHVCNLKIENDALKAILNQKLPTTVTNDLLTTCVTSIPDNVDNMVSSIVSKMKDTESQVITSLLKQQKSFCISSAVAPDCPIVYASPGFAELTGYDVRSILGRNCRFLQGPETNPEHVRQLRQAIKSNQEVQAVLRNYRKNGTPFWNFIQISPLKDLQGMMTLIIGVQIEIENPPMEVRNVRIIHPEQTMFSKYTASGDIVLPLVPQHQRRNHHHHMLSSPHDDASSSLSLASTDSELFTYQTLSDVDFKKMDHESSSSSDKTTRGSCTGSVTGSSMMNCSSETSSTFE